MANLTAGEICEQVLHVERHAPTIGCHWRVTNVVMMGMGEPLNNYREVVSALQTMRDVWELAPSRLTVSTVGVVNRMRQLAHDAPGVSLALSLHAATQETLWDAPTETIADIATVKKDASNPLATVTVT